LQELLHDYRNREILQHLQGLWLHRAGRRRQGRVRARHGRRSCRHALAERRPEGLVRHRARRARRQGGEPQGRLNTVAKFTEKAGGKTAGLFLLISSAAFRGATFSIRQLSPPSRRSRWRGEMSQRSVCGTQTCAATEGGVEI